MYGPEWKRYADPATELDVIRLTDPQNACGMTAPHLRQFSRRGNYLLHWSDRTGARQAYQLDLKNGDSRQLTDVGALDFQSLSLAADEKSVFCFDGASLLEIPFGSLSARRIHEAPDRLLPAGLTVAGDSSVLFAAHTGAQSTVFRATRQRPGTGFAVDGEIDLLMARPRRSQVLYRTAQGVWLANLDGGARRQLRLEPGGAGEMLWSPSGRSLLYLHIPTDPRQLVSLRENIPDENVDTQLARTSQFAAFSPNNDASVFAGASRSRASAYVLILLRVTRRELTLCEHRASDPAMVSPVFSPDSQSVFFVSDRHGKSALYRVHVEKFVEQTDDEN